MIVFDLICKDQHRFEGWFASGEDFTSQKGQGLLECPICGGAHVEKLPAAKIRKQSEPAVPAQISAAQPDKTGKFDVSRIIDYILAHSEDVGKSFAEEARKIHYQETPQRSIRGVASRTEAEDLRDEGIPVFSLPVPPQDRWN
ncbi:MAG: hypothetical protein A3G20_09475 [Acidobacteria bacterium RIFCSPLOWO2_12_FULL_59_11]|nr:MAG: hypothetical protein A3G20_09475 [Acidobacteria bacterium RIFCSPLOWO2_12_FULL_59_11]